MQIGYVVLMKLLVENHGGRKYKNTHIPVSRMFWYYVCCATRAGLEGR